MHPIGAAFPRVIQTMRFWVDGGLKAEGAEGIHMVYYALDTTRLSRKRI